MPRRCAWHRLRRAASHLPLARSQRDSPQFFSDLLMPIEIPEWLAADFVFRAGGGATAIVRHDFAEVFDTAGLIASPSAEPDLTHWAPPNARVRAWGVWSALPGGRAPVRVIPAGRLGEAVVRPYRRGGLARRFAKRRYFGGDRALEELETTERLRRRGARVPEALAAVQQDFRLGYAACLVTRRIPGARPASVLLRQAPRPTAEAWMERIGRSVRRLHTAGGWHADLNAHNILIHPGPGGEELPVLIDLDRGRALDEPVTGRRARANLQRLRRSIEKLELEAARGAWAALERGYAEGAEAPA